MTTTSGPIQFDFGALLKQAWQLFTANIGVLLGSIVLFIVINVVAGSFTMNLASIVLSGPFILGLVTIWLKIARGQQVEFSEIFSGFQRFLPAFMAYLLTTIFTVIGMFLCIIPGFFVSMIYLFTFFYMYDEKLDFWPSMERSRIVAMENLGQFVLLFLIVLALNLVGCIACGIGLLVSAPISGLMIALAYEQVTGRGTTVAAEPTPMQ